MDSKLNFPLGHTDLALIESALGLLIEKTEPIKSIKDYVEGLQHRIRKERETHETIKDNAELFDGWAKSLTALPKPR